MKLRRLRIEQLRQFRSPLEIRDFEDGVNLFTGSNESGKSSIVRAIRAAFFERHRSSSVEDLCPWNDSTAAPTIELDFDFGETRYSLVKSFLHRKRCDLKIGNVSYESTEAEDKLAELLGFQFAGKGASRAEHWGIPGLLWIEQGTGQEVHTAVANATDHLRSALNTSMGEVTSTSGDDVLEQARADRGALLTATKRPTGALQAGNAELLAAKARLYELDGQIATYREQVDSLGALRVQNDAEAIDKPWERFRAEMKGLVEQQAELRQLSQKVAQDQAQLAQANTNVELRRQQLADLERMDRGLVAREDALTAALSSVALTTALHQDRADKLSAAQGTYEEAGRILRVARASEQCLSLSRSIDDFQSRLDKLTASVASAKKAQEQLSEARRNALATEIDSGALATLQQQHRGLRELEIRQGAIATRLKFDLQTGHTVTLDGRAVDGQGERLLVAAGELAIPGIGQITITPGGMDLGQLARERSELQEAHDALLQRVGVQSIDAALQRDVEHQKHVLDRGHAGNALAIHAPNGLETLTAELAEITTRHSDAVTELHRLPESTESTDLSQAEAEQAQEDAREVLMTVTQAVADAKHALATAEADRDSAQRERDVLHKAVLDPDRKRRRAEADKSLLETIPLCRALEVRIEEQAAQITNAQPEMLAQDIERLRRSADQTEKAHRSRGEEIIRLQTQLQAAGAQGLEELASDATVLVQQLARRQEELTRRAAALDLLVTLLEEKRRELTRRLQAPLQNRITHYLKLLMPQASLEIDENLMPGLLTRPGARADESGPFGDLSFGAREQMGIISRLAYADLLKEAGRPTLIILDDALVHSDEIRLAHMKRILFDASQRHQVLLFTCHPAAWNDLGAAPRTMELLRQSGSTQSPAAA